MYSHRKHPANVHSNKQQITSSKIPAKSGYTKRKSSVSIQTDNLPGCGGLCNFSAMPIDEIKEHYSNTLRFLNKCHEYINSILKGEVPTLKVQKLLEFRVPDVPNYFNVLEEFLAPSENHSSFEISNKNPSFMVKQCEEKNEDAEQVLFNFNQFIQNEDFFIDPPQKISGTSAPKLVETDDVKVPSPNEIQMLSNTFEEILQTCNEFENKSIEYMLQHDIALLEPPIQQQQQTVKHMQIVDINHQPKGFNLLEYALKNRSRASSDLSSRSSSNQSLNADTPGNTLQEVFANVKKSFTVLNAAPQCHSPKRVNELFEKISRESLKHSKCDDESKSDKINRKMENSSSESIILSDEEFYRRRLSNSETWGQPMVQSWCQINQRSSSRKSQPRKIPPKQPEPEKISKCPRLKSNPLTLNEKDRTKVDQKVLKTIGLFTENGEIRPDVITLLEEKQNFKYTQDNAKNVKFRTEKQMNVEVRFNNHNMTMSDITSDESSIGMSPTGTISDSDLLMNKSPENNTLKTSRL